MYCLPCQVREVAVRGACHHLTTNSSELLHAVDECNDLCWTHKCAERNQAQGITNLHSTVHKNVQWYSACK